MKLLCTPPPDTSFAWTCLSTQTGFPGVSGAEIVLETVSKNFQPYTGCVISQINCSAWNAYDSWMNI